jgi:prepilin-type N-terminal cleavage/methylation domain-containing protein
MAYKIKHRGFTIIELMIAMTVFSAAMVIVLAGVIVISRQYQQASNRVAMEEATRNIHQQIGDSIRFSGVSVTNSSPSGDWVATCVGNLMFVYPISTPFAGSIDQFNSRNSGLFVKQDGDCNVPADVGPSGAVNVLPGGAKVTRFSVTDTEILTTFAKSPGDLLTIPASGGQVTCNITITGREFCAAVSMQSSVVRRVIN